MRRFCLTFLFSFLVLWLAGCVVAPPAPRTVHVSEARLAELIGAQFPFSSTLLDVLEVGVSSPRIQLDPQANRIRTALDLSVAGNSLVGLLTRNTYKGGIDLSYGLRFEPSDGSVRMSDVRVVRLNVEGAPDALRRPIERLGATLAQRLLKDYVLYKAKPTDLQAAEGWGYAPGTFRVEATGLSITLDPVALR